MLTPPMTATDEELAEYLVQLLVEGLEPAQIVRKLLNAHRFGVPWNRIRFPDD